MHPQGVAAVPAQRVEVLYVSRDGGLTWTASAPVRTYGSNEVGLPSVALLDPLHAWSYSGVRLFATTDGGLHWSAFSDRAVPEVTLFALGFQTPEDGWAMAGLIRGATEWPYLYRTTDGGSDWQVIGPILMSG